MALLIIKTGSTPHAISARLGDFEDWFRRHLTVPKINVVAVHAGDALPAHRGIERVLITGSAHMVTERHDWSEQTAAWLREAHAIGMPILGVCYGHQLLAHALGGAVDWNPHGRQIGLTEIALEPQAQADALLGGFGPAFNAFTTHQQSVLALPKGAVLLASTAKDPHHAFRVGERSWGVQFHPEFNEEIMHAYLDDRHAHLSADGINVEALKKKSKPAPEAARILTRFAQVPSHSP